MLACLAALILVGITVKPTMASLGPLFVSAPGVDPAEHMGSVAGGIVGTLLGSLAFCAGIPWAVVYFAWVRQRAPGRGPRDLLIIAAVVLVAELVVVRAAYVQSHAQANNAAMMDFRSVLQAIQREGPGAKIDTAPVTGGDAGIAESLAKQLWAALAADHDHYIGELTQLGVIDMLKPDRLATEDLGKAAATVEQARAIEAKYRTLEESRFTDLTAQVQRSGMSESAKAEFLASFQKDEPEEKAKRDQVWGFETAILDDMAKIVAMLRESRGSWSSSGRTLTFSSLDVMTRYNDAVADIQSNADQEKALQQREVDQAVSSLPAQSSQ